MTIGAGETAVQANALRNLCRQMCAQMFHVRDWPAALPADPMPVIETRLRRLLGMNTEYG